MVNIPMPQTVLQLREDDEMGFSDGEQLTTDSARIFGHSPD
jgi:hypothetical protein